MAFTTLPTYGTGDTVTAANWNTHIKDNFAAMPPDVFTASGELFVGEGADTGQLLSPGTRSDVLIAASGQAEGMMYSDTAVGSKFVFAQYTNADYSGDDTFGGATFEISVHAATGYNIPVTANMLIARMRVWWNAGSTDDYVKICNTADTAREMLRIDYTATTFQVEQMGFVTTAGGNLRVEITDSSDITFALQFSGYTTS